MSAPTNQGLLALLLASTLTSATATSPGIGLATANGSFAINSSKVWGNATVLDGSTVETSMSPAEIRLTNGARLRLATDSRAKLFQERIVLEKGASQLESGATNLEALSLRIQAASGDAVARVNVNGDKQVMVAALKGNLRVLNARGVLVANVGAGNALSFDPQAGAAGPAKISGCLLRKDGKYIIVDQTTNVSVQVEGAGLEKEVGNRVEVTGAESASPATGGASQRLNVSSIKRIGKGGCTSVAKKAGAASGGATAAGTTAAGGVGGGIAAGTVAIVGGVAAASVVGGLAAAGTFSGDESRPTTSR